MHAEAYQFSTVVEVHFLWTPKFFPSSDRFSKGACNIDVKRALLVVEVLVLTRAYISQRACKCTCHLRNRRLLKISPVDILSRRIRQPFKQVVYNWHSRDIKPRRLTLSITIGYQNDWTLILTCAEEVKNWIINEATKIILTNQVFIPCTGFPLQCKLPWIFWQTCFLFHWLCWFV